MVSFYGMVGSYTLQWTFPSLTARPETRIHGREVRVNMGWPSPHLVQKSPADQKFITTDRIWVRPTVDDMGQMVYSYFYLRQKPQKTLTEILPFGIIFRDAAGS